MRDELWFKHDARSRLDPKMAHFLKLAGITGYGVFWALIETLHYQNDHEIDLDSELPGLADQLKLEETELRSIVDKLVFSQLFQRQENIVFQARLKQDQAKRSAASSASFASRCFAGHVGGLISGAKRRGASPEEIQTLRSKIEAKRSDPSLLEATKLDKKRVDKKRIDIGSLEQPAQIEANLPEKTKNFAPGITLTEQGFKSLQSEFGDESFRYHLPICSDWLKANGKRKSDAAAFMRNWIRKELAERKGFYFPKREQFKPHTAATTAEKNLDYFRNRYGEDYVKQMFAGDVVNQEKSIGVTDDGGDLVPGVVGAKQ